MQKLLKGEIRLRSSRNVVQARSFSEMLEQSLRRYQNRAIETAKVIEELIQLAKDMREAGGGELNLTEDEVAFYDALGEKLSYVRAKIVSFNEEVVRSGKRSGRLAIG